MLTIDTLNKFGADTAEGLGRCYGQEEFYLNLVKMIPDEKNFGLLKEAIDKNDLDAAFEAAHALKGVLANLSLTPLSKTAGEITEHLRARTQMDYAPLMKQLEDKRAELAALM